MALCYIVHYFPCMLHALQFTPSLKPRHAVAAPAVESAAGAAHAWTYAATNAAVSMQTAVVTASRHANITISCARGGAWADEQPDAGRGNNQHETHCKPGAHQNDIGGVRAQRQQKASDESRQRGEQPRGRHAFPRGPGSFKLSPRGVSGGSTSTL